MIVIVIIKKLLLNQNDFLIFNDSNVEIDKNSVRKQRAK